MDRSLIIILSIILVLLIVLNHVSISMSTNSNTNAQTANCSNTKFGCCPDGANSKINALGSNCPRYNPGPGYPSPLPPPPIRRLY
jgi:hypothetical protein